MLTLALLAAVLLLSITIAVLLVTRRRVKVDRNAEMRARLSTPAAQLEVAQRIREARLLGALEAERNNEVLRLVNQELANVPPRTIPVTSAA